VVDRLLNSVSGHLGWRSPTTLYVPWWFPDWLKQRFFDAWEAEESGRTR